MLFAKLKNNKDWPADPAFKQHNLNFLIWIRDLPQDLQVVHPSNSSSFLSPSHFVANMHAYYHLSIIVHYRPQLQFLIDSGDASWKQHMVICYSSAKNL
ncbi:hypothetical protein B0A49_13862, partial [Cryomyces minteri]